MKFQYNEYSLDLGTVEVAHGSFKMENSSSYLQKFVKRYNSSKNYRENLLPLKLQCLLNIQNIIAGKYNSYFEPFAGIGITAKIFACKEMWLNDMSTECSDILYLNYKDKIVMNSNANHLINFPNLDLIFADFNNLTIKRALGEYKPLLDKTFATAQKYVILNDCSVFFLRYGKSSYDVYSKLYGGEIKNKDDFYGATIGFWNKLYPDWYVTRIEGFKDSSFILLSKEKVRPVVHINETHSIKTQIV